MAERSLRVLALVPDSFGGHGGIALYLSDLVSATASLQDVREITLLSRNPIPRDTVLPEKVLVQPSKGGKFGWLAGLVRLLARDRDFGLIICGHINFLPAAMLAKLLCQAELLLMIYGIDAWQPVYGRLGRWLLHRRIQVVSISEHTTELFCRWSMLNATAIAQLPNAIHAARYGMAKPDEGLKARYGIRGKKVLLTLCRLAAKERYKGVDEILDVLPEVIREVPDLVYVVAGDGDDRERLTRLVSERHLSSFVTFTGRVREDEKAAHFQMADAFAMPGRKEGFGFVFLEAMACGVPVVASKVDGSREAVQNGAIGQMVDPANRVELKEALLRALNTPKQIPTGLSHFSFPRFVERLRTIYSAMELVSK